jgi:hypothetical protein
MPSSRASAANAGDFGFLKRQKIGCVGSKKNDLLSYYKEYVASSPGRYYFLRHWRFPGLSH